jgi:hypothetical protein
VAIPAALLATGVVTLAFNLGQFLFGGGTIWQLLHSGFMGFVFVTVGAIVAGEGERVISIVFSVVYAGLLVAALLLVRLSTDLHLEAPFGVECVFGVAAVAGCVLGVVYVFKHHKTPVKEW